jgi:5-oxoprolinase (ATP-hydrolysing)
MHGYRYTDHEARAARCPRDRLHPGLDQPRGLAADEAGGPRRHHGGRCLSLAHPAPLCRPGRVANETGRATRPVRPASSDSDCPTLMFMQSSGGLTAAELFQGKDAILSGPAGGVVGMVETGPHGRLRQAHRLRHGRHLDRRRPLMTASSNAPSKPKWRACACARR